MNPAHRLTGLGESVIREMTRLALEHNAINLSQGFPDFDPPPEVLEAAVKAVQNGFNQYSITWGARNLREAIARSYANRYDLTLDPDVHITVTCGVTEAVIAALMSVVNPGDKVIIIDPSHENFMAGVVFAGGEPVWVSLRPPHFELDEAELRAAFAQNPKAIIVNTPHNPSGRVFERQTLQLIADLCQQHNTIAITDEIYEHILYDGREHISLATFPGMAERTIMISGITKTFAVTGWRVAWAVAPPALAKGFRTVHDFLTICAPAPLQEAAAVALTLPPDYYTKLRADYHVRRDTMLAILEEAGFHASPPGGTYYVMADYRAINGKLNSVEFAEWLIKERGVAVVPGSSFYRGNPAQGDGVVRFAFPKRPETLEAARKRLVGR